MLSRSGVSSAFAPCSPEECSNSRRKKIARELKFFRRNRDALRISLELVDVDNGFQLWGANYNRKRVDIFAVQDEIASEVSERLKLKLSGEERKRLRKRPTKDLEAYQEYLRGRHAWNRRPWTA